MVIDELSQSGRDLLAFLAAPGLVDVDDAVDV